MTSCKTNLVAKLRATAARRRAVGSFTRELAGSSDRALAEMGIARGDIPAVADGSYRRGDPA